MHLHFGEDDLFINEIANSRNTCVEITPESLIQVQQHNADHEFTVTAPGGGTNTITVRDGHIAVTAATCPDHYCMHRGFCDRGTQIVCLPNRLVIRFLGEQNIDAVAG